MTTRNTTNGFKVTIDIDDRIDDFNFYCDGDFCFKNVSRDYKLPNDLDMEDWKIDYLVNWKTKEEIIEEDDGYINEDDFIALDKLKEWVNIVWLTFFDYGGGNICVKEYARNEYDWLMILPKDADIQYTIKTFNAWLMGRIYRVAIYEPKYYTSDNWDGKKVIEREYIDGGSGFIDFDDAKNSLPEYVWELTDESDNDNRNRFELC